MYKLTTNVRSQNDQEYSNLQELISVGFVSDQMVEVLNRRVKAKCATENNNDWYKNGKQVMITSTHEIKDRFNTKQLNNLQEELITFPAIDIPTKQDQILPNLSNIQEKKPKVLLLI